MNVLIIEDERRAANRLSKMIHTFDPSITILDRLESVSMAIDWFRSHPLPDLIFMDIQLGDGLCFDIFEECSITVPVIFTTAYDQFAIKAFSFYGIGYLLKPVSFPAFKAAVDRFLLIKGNFAGAQLYRQTGSLIKSPLKEKVVVKVGEHLNIIKMEEVSFIGSRDKYTYLYKADQKKCIIDYTLEQLEQLIDPYAFFRVNRSYIVHREAIAAIRTYVNSRLILQMNIPVEGPEIIVSRERVADFRKWLEMHAC